MHSLIRHQLTRGPARASPGLGRRCGRGPAGLSAHSSQEGHGLRRESARRWLVLTLQDDKGHRRGRGQLALEGGQEGTEGGGGVSLTGK